MGTSILCREQGRRTHVQLQCQGASCASDSATTHAKDTASLVTLYQHQEASPEPACGATPSHGWVSSRHSSGVYSFGIAVRSSTCNVPGTTALIRRHTYTCPVQMSRTGRRRPLGLSHTRATGRAVGKFKLTPGHRLIQHQWSTRESWREQAPRRATGCPPYCASTACPRTRSCHRYPSPPGGATSSSSNFLLRKQKRSGDAKMWESTKLHRKEGGLVPRSCQGRRA